MTAFLGPNDAGESTTLRMITGLTRPDHGQATVAGHPFTAWPNPSHIADVLLDAAAVHPGRSGRGHLRMAATLLVLSASATALQLPWYAVLTLPVLFAAGMSLLDTIDGVVISATYEWATTNPVRRVFYNLVVTGLSVAVVVGSIELLGLLGEKLGVRSGPLAWAASLDLEGVGYLVAALFLLTWLAGILTWKLGRFEQRWDRPVVQLDR